MTENMDVGKKMSFLERPLFLVMNAISMAIGAFDMSAPRHSFLSNYYSQILGQIVPLLSMQDRRELVVETLSRIRAELLRDPHIRDAIDHIRRNAIPDSLLYDYVVLFGDYHSIRALDPEQSEDREIYHNALMCLASAILNCLKTSQITEDIVDRFFQDIGACLSADDKAYLERWVRNRYPHVL